MIKSPLPNSETATTQKLYHFVANLQHFLERICSGDEVIHVEITTKKTARSWEVFRFVLSKLLKSANGEKRSASCPKSEGV